MFRWTALVLLVFFEAVGLYLLAHHSRKQPAWWLGWASVCQSIFALSLSLGFALPSVSLAQPWLARLVPWSIALALLAFLAFSLSVQLYHPLSITLKILVSILVAAAFTVIVLTSLDPSLIHIVQSGQWETMAGPLYPFWALFVVGSTTAVLALLARALYHAPTITARRRLLGHMIAFGFLAAGGIIDNLTGIVSHSWPPLIAVIFYVGGGLLVVVTLLYYPFIPGLRLNPKDMGRQTGLAATSGITTVGLLHLVAAFASTPPSPAADLVACFWVIALVLGREIWRKSPSWLPNQEIHHLREHLRLWMQQASPLSPDSYQLEKLLIALGQALASPAVLLMRREASDWKSLGNYLAFQTSDLAEVLTVTQPADLPALLNKRHGMAINLADGIHWLVVDGPLDEDIDQREMDNLIERVGIHLNHMLYPEHSPPPREQETLLLKELDQGAQRGQLRSALRNLHDPFVLGKNPLSAYCPGQDALERGKALRDLIFEGIDALCPVGMPDDTRNWRRYRILRELYVKGLPPSDVWEILGISKRTYQRGLNDGIESLLTWLTNQWH